MVCIPWINILTDCLRSSFSCKSFELKSLEIFGKSLKNCITSNGMSSLKKMANVLKKVFYDFLCLFSIKKTFFSTLAFSLFWIQIMAKVFKSNEESINIIVNHQMINSPIPGTCPFYVCMLWHYRCSLLRCRVFVVVTPNMEYKHASVTVPRRDWPLP